MRAAPYFVVLLIPLVLVLGVAGGSWFAGAGIAFVFVATPLLDRLLGRRLDNDGTEGTARRRVQDLPLLLWVLVQLSVTVWIVDRLATQPGSALEQTLAIVSLGLMTGGAGITVAHELMHRSARFERGLAELLMTAVSYPHFCIEHVHGHHRHVATPLDPASSRLGESAYGFLPRTLLGGLRSAWRIEAERMRRSGHAVIGPRNRMLRYAAVQLVMYAAIAACWGERGVLVWAAQAAIAVVLLELVNYVEHYGLARAPVGEGRYERTQPWHSWNASERFSNWMLFNLQRHSDHHFLAARPYEKLRHYDDVPQLPAGYATMVLLALVPPLWRRVMDPRVAAAARHRGGERTSIAASS
ncbi:MAG: alkane 1-monooxygenase [Deltaproteobacteria bacterium]|nr:alkane 1-monooxygenase [Nannocystaceae bacterium]